MGGVRRYVGTAGDNNRRENNQQNTTNKQAREAINTEEAMAEEKNHITKY